MHLLMTLQDLKNDIVSISDCPSLNIQHGSISTTVVIKDTVVNITCDTDYSLEGEAQLTCITGGVWDYAEPECTRGKTSIFWLLHCILHI